MSCDMVLVRARSGPSSDRNNAACWPPFGILNIAVHLRRQGFRITIVDRFGEAHAEVSPDEAAESILALGPTAVGISAMTSQCGDAMDLGDALMKRSSAVRVVYGGTHFASTPEDGLAHGHCVITGEGEYALAEMLSRGPSAFTGILPGTKMTEEEMEAIPLPGPQDLLETAFDPKKVAEFPVITARGCPFDCNFCKDGFRFASAVRSLSVDHVVRHLDEIHRTFGFQRFFIMDDIFTLSMTRLEEMSQAIEKHGLDLRFRCFLHANTVTEPRLELAKKIGIDRVSIGVESGNDAILRTIGKGTTTKKQRKAIELCREFGFEVTGLYMIGNTGESIRTVVDTISFARSLPTHSDWFSFAVPFPGTPFASLVDRYGKIIEPDFRLWNNENLVYLPDGFSEKEMHRFMEIARNLCLYQGKTPPEVSATWHGPLLDATPEAEEGSSLLLELFRLGAKVSARETSFSGPVVLSALDEERRSTLDELIARPLPNGSIAILQGAATSFRKVEGAAAHVGRTTFPAESLPGTWVTRCNEMDEVWVPSEFHRRTFVASGVQRPVVVVPQGVDSARFGPEVPPHEIADENCFTFLSTLPWNLAWGLDILLDAWTAAFGKEDAVRLLLVPSGGSGPIAGAPLSGGVERLYRARGQSLSDAAPILVSGNSSYREVPGLFAAADAFVFPVRGTTWGTCVRQAMATSLPVIATAWGGHTELVTEEIAYPICLSGMAEIAEECGMASLLGQRWAEPSRDHLVELLRAVLADRDTARAKGERARTEMVDRWPWSRSALFALDRLTTLTRQTPVATTPAPARELSPSVTMLLRGAGAFQDEGRLMDALQSVKQALQLAPDDPRCYVILAQVGIAAGNENVVRSALSRLHALDPSHPLLEALTRGQGGSSLPTAGV